MKYRIALYKSEEGYAVSVPGLPGCWSQGTTEQEAFHNVQDAIREYLAAVDDEIKRHDHHVKPAIKEWGRVVDRMSDD